MGEVFQRYSEGEDYQRIIDWFDLGGSLRVSSEASTKECLDQFRGIQGLVDRADGLLGPGNHSAEQRVAAAEFILEGPYTQKKINRNEERVFQAVQKKQRETIFEEFPDHHKKWN